MTPIFATLHAIEQRAERAIDRELQTMMQDILALRTSLVLGERSEADSLLIKLDRLLSVHNARTAGNCEQQPPPNNSTGLRAMECMQSPDIVYQASFFDPQFGSLEDVIPASSFASAVQTAFNRLQADIDCTVQASWSHGRGRLEVQTLDGIVVACVQATPSAVVAVHPSIVQACQALRDGETVLSQAQFAQALLARATMA